MIKINKKLGFIAMTVLCVCIMIFIVIFIHREKEDNLILNQQELPIRKEPEYGYPLLEQENQYFQMKHFTQSLLEQLIDYEFFIEFEEDELPIVALIAKSKVKEFSFFSVKVNEENFLYENIFFEKGEMLYEIEELNIGEAFIVDWYDPGIVSQRGISFINEESEEMMYVFSTSGLDGTLHLLE